MKSILRSIKAKGFLNFIRRLFILFNRFGFSASKMRKCLMEYNDILAKNDCKPCFFITADLLIRYDKMLKNMYDTYSLHGYRHIDYSFISDRELAVHLDNAVNIVKQKGINTAGFRFPYLRFGERCIEQLVKKGFKYDSSQSILWPVIPNTERIKDYYKPLDPLVHASMPYLRDGLLEIPVSLPDDEILIDRLGIKDVDRIFSIWNSILKTTYDKKEIFVLQLHPERIFICGEALDRLIREAKNKKPPVWITTLSELSNWWLDNAGIRNNRWPDNYQSVLCITGDIDAITLWDFLKRL